MSLQEGVDLFNNQKFFECHDYFEAIWIKCNDRDRQFYQGMVQAAVGCHHFKKNHYNSAIGQYKKSVQKLKLYPGVFMGVNTGLLIKKLETLLAELEIISSGESRVLKDLECPKIEYNNLTGREFTHGNNDN